MCSPLLGGCTVSQTDEDLSGISPPQMYMVKAVGIWSSWIFLTNKFVKNLKILLNLKLFSLNTAEKAGICL